MPILQNPRWEKFAQELAKGKSATEAYHLAGYIASKEAARRNASRLLLTKADVRARVADLQAKAAEAAIVTRASLIMEAAEIQQLAVRDKQFSSAVSALTAKAKLAREWPSEGEPPRNEAAALGELSNEELLQSIAQQARELGIDIKVTELRIGGPRRREPRLVNGGG